MSPHQAIAMLDRQLARNGQTVVLIRGDDRLTVRGWVRDYTPDELASGISQGGRRAILSPTGLTGVFLAVPPDKNDEIEAAGRIYNIASCEPVLVADVLVRLNLQVNG